MSTTPDFSIKTVNELAKRASQTCSNPECRKPTSGPHSDASKSVMVGEAAHIRGARPGSARYDLAMTDDERADPANGIWLCCTCAKLIDTDMPRFSVSLLDTWKTEHETWIQAGRPVAQAAAREISVTDDGIGGIITNEGNGTALKIEGAPGQTAERIHVQGRGIGEIITNTGSGTAKIVRSSGGISSQSTVSIDQPVRMAIGLISKVVMLTCSHCGTQFNASKVVQGFAGDEEPRVEIKCPKCGWPTWV